MTDQNPLDRLETRLQERADRLASKPLLPDARAAELRETMRGAAQMETWQRSRRQWALSVLGAAAALLLLLLVPDPLPQFGRAEVDVAFLDPSGRVLEETALRSDGAQVSNTFPQFLLELVAVEDCIVAARVGNGMTWKVPASSDLSGGAVSLSTGDEWLQEIPWPGPGEVVLLVLSKQPIAAELLDAHLASSGSTGLEDAFGCRVVSRRFAPLASED